MVQAKITLAALYSYDQTIFDGLTVPVDKQTVIDNILLECFPFETLFPNPEFLKQAITIWSNSCQTVWNHLYETMNYKYNPIWNKDGSYTEEVHTGAESESGRIDSVKGFNSDNWAEHTKSEGNTTASGTETRTRKEQGNIGITTTQQMIQEERNIAEFNLIRYITEDFKNRFCIVIY